MVFLSKRFTIYLISVAVVVSTFIGLVLPLNPVEAKSTIREYNSVYSGLQQLDQEPLGERTALLLIHGISPEEGEYDNWGGFLDYIQADHDRQEAFNKQYKIFLFRYPARGLLKDNTALLNQELKLYQRFYPGRSIQVIAHSLGGLIIRNALVEDAETRNIILRAVTIGTPFHGTPLADPEWIKAGVDDHSFMFFAKIPTKLAYNVTENKLPPAPIPDEP